MQRGMRTRYRGDVRDDVLGITFHFDDDGALHRDPGQGPAVVHDTSTEEWWDHGRRTTFVTGERDLVTDKRNNDCIPSVRGVPYLAFITYIGGTPPRFRNGTPRFKVTMYTNRTAGLYTFHPFDATSGGWGPHPHLWSIEGVLKDCLKTVTFCGLKSQVGAFTRRIAWYADSHAKLRASAERDGIPYVIGAELRGLITGWDPRKGVHHCEEIKSVLELSMLDEFATYPREADGITVRSTT